MVDMLFICKTILGSFRLSARNQVKYHSAYETSMPLNLMRFITTSPPILHHDREDKLVWQSYDGKDVCFSTSSVWDSIRNHHDEVYWVNLVWFSQCIPSHAFNMWLILKKKLKTQDRLKPWDVGGATNLNLMCCSLCQRGPDSHYHLFFECSFSLQVWLRVRHLAGMQHISAKWDDIVAWLIPISKASSTKSVIGRLLVAATAYFVWQERNNRLFSNKKRTVMQLEDVVVETVRFKLISLKFKDSTMTRLMLKDWKCSENLSVKFLNFLMIL